MILDCCVFVEDMKAYWSISAIIKVKDKHNLISKIALISLNAILYFLNALAIKIKEKFFRSQHQLGSGLKEKNEFSSHFFKANLLRINS